MFVDGNQQMVAVVWIRGLLDLKESGSERGPLVDDLKEGNLGVLSADTVILGVVLLDGLSPVSRTLCLHLVCRYQLSH